MKKGVVLFLLFILVFSILTAIIPAQATTQPQDRGLWQVIKENVGGFFGDVGNTIGSAFHTTENTITSKLGWLFGTRSFSGDKIWIFSTNFWTWNYFWAYVLTGVLSIIWIALFYFLEYKFFIGHSALSKRIFTARIIRNGMMMIIAIIIYPLLMGIPVINRFLQIITFETLGLSLFWRSLVITFEIYLAPSLFLRYIKYRTGKKIYEDELKKAVGEEKLRILGGTR